MKSDLDDDAENAFADWQDRMTRDMQRVNEQHVRLRCLALAVQVYDGYDGYRGNFDVLATAKDYYTWIAAPTPLPPLDPPATAKPRAGDLQ